ncbi:UPF0149 family protein [Roseovarius sp. M141]|uniref:UPF0149 family protein n=1 Tax=Roseovarius sp. M141 TaxID=2583806 RepID=UPI0020CF8171|nr:UPF0149 family protein [Roseovarius sp. M141]MCQ0090520.1 UPF0149 family protein [Roseovarius sp. M141]
MKLKTELSDSEEQKLGDFLGRVRGGAIPNVEALDGFFAALACCPDLVMPSEYMPILQNGATEDGDLEFEDMEEAGQFVELVNRHWSHVNRQLDSEEVYLPLVLEDENGRYQANDWAQGFLRGTELRREIWFEIMDDENEGGAMVPIWALAYEHHEDPEMRPFDEPVSDDQRQELLIGAAGGVMRMHRYFLKQRNLYTPPSGTFTRSGSKTGRNDPCPCGSGKKFKQCCGRRTMLH